MASSETKLFQRQILKLKTLKGILTDGQPSVKCDGFLSIERAKNVPCLVFRSFIGATLFTGVLNASSAKVKALTAAEHSNGKGHENRLRAKAAVLVSGKSKFEVEYLELTFMNEVERQTFIKVFEEAAKK